MVEIALIVSIFLLIAALFGLWFFFQKKLKTSEEDLKNSFRSLSLEAIEQNGRLFLDLAKRSLDQYQEGAKADLEGRQQGIEKSLVPLKEAITKLDAHQRDLERRRESAYASLSNQLQGMVLAEKELRQETAQLAQALRSPNIRGSWGQVHLKRVVELAGLVNYCDFFEQKTIDDKGKLLRPDLVIRLPGDRSIVIDAKTPLDSYLEAVESLQEEPRKKKLQEHASSLRKHIKELAGKEYWKQFDATPDYVILFLPAEAFFSAALEADPSLIEAGIDQSVLIATPTTLIAILRAVAMNWKQESLSKSAQEIAKLGQEFYDRIAIFCDHWNKVGKNLNTAVDAFNQSAASLEARVLVTARKLKEVACIHKPPPEAVAIDVLAKPMLVISSESEGILSEKV